MAKLQQKSKCWFDNLNDARGYKSNVSRWPLLVAAVAFALAVVIIIVKL